MNLEEKAEGAQELIDLINKWRQQDYEVRAVISILMGALLILIRETTDAKTKDMFLQIFVSEYKRIVINGEHFDEGR